MKKMSSGLVLMLCVALLLSACSGNNGNEKTGESNSGSNSDTVTHLKFWGAIPEENGPKQALDTWNAANPDIQVEYVRYINDEAGNTKLETALLAKGEIDLFINYSMDKLVKRIQAGMAEPLDTYVQNDSFDLKDQFGENAIVKMEDKTYYIPAIILNDFVSINKSMLDEANLPIPTDWTWDEYVSYASKLSKGQGNDKVWGSFVNGAQPKIFEYMDKAVKTELGANAMYKEDGSSNFDNAAFKKYLDVMFQMEKTDKSQPPYAEAKMSKMEGSRMFLGGQVAMNWVGTASLRDIKNLESYPHDFVTAFAPPPKISTSSKNIGGGTGYLDYVTINSQTKNKDAAWKFMKWYVTEGNEPLIAGGRVPAWKHADQDKVAELILGDNAEKLFDINSFKAVAFGVKDFVVDTKFDKYPELQVITNEEGERALIGDETTAEAVANMKKRADELLGK
ncbi:ABC transporter substrate-binding protein [Paenibacillus nasutitermitis]|uniref:Sugar ABC transporter substrate-binding protein n=1 Tax=Paenibacillus nasutitermitis TaxID=1652958 RepID=A0A916YPV5_9BACL|nr:extracellular solute-binding protein [Paenibacillus nasutitermitis]GGD56116.1 sugar ABC transporter substrate-binding protein [Paenibacillus nasutitermitis]